MKAFISGEAGAGVLMGQRLVVYSGGTTTFPWHAQDALRVFDGCCDVRLIDVESKEDLNRRLEIAWAEDRVLRLFLFLIDPEEPDDELHEYAECVDELLAHNPILEALKQKLVASALPCPIDVTRIERACVGLGRVLELFHWLLSVQSVVVRVRQAFDAVPLASDEKKKLFVNLVEEGAFAEVVTDMLAGKDLSFLRLKIVSQHRASMGPISNWFQVLQGNLKRISRADIRNQEAESVDDRLSFSDDARLQSAAAFNSVMAEQRMIAVALKDRDIGKARRLMKELVASQVHSSTPEQLAKSLSNMSQRARLYDIPELALEWSREATRANPVDPIAFGHLANILIETASFGEAEEALNQVERNGDPLFAATGRARIMRAQGRVSQARNTFVATAKSFEGYPGVEHAQLGAAEALRELGDIEGALAEYEQLSIYAPAGAGVWTGLASTLVDLGRIEDALQAYSKAATYDSILAQTGKAHAYRVFGDLVQSLALYEGVLAEYPNNFFALVGRGGVLQDQGKLDLALAAYDLAVQRSPYRVEPLIGKMSILRLMDRFDEAIKVNYEARFLFASDRRVSNALVSIYRKQGLFTKALIASDQSIAAFPFDFQARVNRAGILSRLGAMEEAMIAYDAVLMERDTHLSARLGKAALLIKLGRNSEAAAILPQRQASTRTDWRIQTMRAFMVEGLTGYAVASEMLRDFISRCPFAAERRRMIDLCATIELRRSNWRVARKLVETHSNEISNLVSLHVFAATRRMDRAKQYLNRIRSSPGPADVINLAEEIARRHRLTPESPLHPEGWIEMTERNILLAEAI